MIVGVIVVCAAIALGVAIGRAMNRQECHKAPDSSVRLEMGKDAFWTNEHAAWWRSVSSLGFYDVLVSRVRGILFDRTMGALERGEDPAQVRGMAIGGVLVLRALVAHRGNETEADGLDNVAETSAMQQDEV